MGSWDLGKISGIRIRVHWTFMILPVWVYFSALLAGSGSAAAIMSLVFVLALFGCVLLHELGHSFAARQFGIGTRDITLLPIGGLAALERMPQDPKQELWIAVAGPLVNVVIAAVLGTFLIAAQVPASGWIGEFLWQLTFANIALVIFNMIPAFPMDGGRVLRSVLGMFTSWLTATRIAVRVGNVCAMGLGLLGLFSGNLILLLIAAFVWFAARAELHHAESTAGYPDNRFGGFQFKPNATAEPAMPQRTDELEGLSVPSSLSVSSVAAWLASRKADACRVVEKGKLIGTITRSDLVIALSNGFGSHPVGAIIR